MLYSIWFMKFWNILLLLSLLMIIPLSRSISFEPSVSVNAVVGSTTIVPIEVFNDLNTSLIDFTFEAFNFTSFNKIDVLETNKSAYVLMKVVPDRVVDSVFNTKSFFYVLQDIPRSPKTFDVSLADGGYSPTILDLKEGDSVLFKNTGTINHAVKSQSKGWDYNLKRNETVTVVLDKIENINYFDTFTSLGGVINVLNRSSFEKVHNPQLQKQLTINMKSVNAETNMAFSLGVNSFSVEYNKQTDGVIEIRNVGNKTSVNTRLNGRWIGFTNNGFSLQPGEKKIIVFTITPEINKSEDTGKTYPIDVFINTDNAPQLNTSIFVSIPQAIVLRTDDSGYYKGIANELAEYCKQHPDVCFGNNANQTVIIRKGYMNINVSEDWPLNIETEMARQGLSLLRLENLEKENDDKTNTRLMSLELISNITTNDVGYIKEQLGKIHFWVAFLIIFVLSVGIMSTITILVFKHLKKNESKNPINMR